MFERVMLLLVTVLHLALVWRGAYLWTGGVPGKQSTEYKQMLANINILHSLRGEPQQQQLTRHQIQRWGIFYLSLGALGLTVLAIGMCKGLPLV